MLPGPVCTALSTRTSRRPNRSPTEPTAARSESWSSRSPTTAWASAPRSRTSAAVRSRLPSTGAPAPTSESSTPLPSVSVRAVMPTSSPASASACAQALPIPRLAPVTSATRRFTRSVSWCDDECRQGAVEVAGVHRHFHVLAEPGDEPDLHPAPVDGRHDPALVRRAREPTIGAARDRHATGCYLGQRLPGRLHVVPRLARSSEASPAADLHAVRAVANPLVGPEL